MPRWTWNVTAGALVLAAVPACTVDLDRSEEAAAAVRRQEIGDLPYHPLVYHLDLSIFAYQLYSQSLVWPFDPYYEELALGVDRRDAFMGIVRDWARDVGRDQTDSPSDDALRGPGALSGFPDNPTHDPILYQYSRLHPWSPSITNDIGKWIEYRTPAAVTDPIAEVHVCTRTTGEPEGAVTVTPLPGRDTGALPGARDVLLVFEGGTGDKREPGQPASQSLMGFALFRFGDDDVFDLHVTLRGSRSGSASRAALEAASTDSPEGNPDWITDLGVRPIEVPAISEVGLVSRGMSRTVESIFPQLFGCLDVVGRETVDGAPRTITVTGHSLGGGLAQHLVSALVLGDAYGPGGDAMPESLRSWPWAQVKLITFGAPRVGDTPWAQALTEDALDASFFGERYTYDYDAIGVTDPAIVPRLLDPERPAAYRVLVPTDPISTSFIVPGSHVGESVYVAQPAETSPPDGEDHEPRVIRSYITDTLRDPERIPEDVWRYVELDTWSPDRDATRAGSRDEYEKLVDANLRYYEEAGAWFDSEAFLAGVDAFYGLLDRLPDAPP